MTSDFDAARHEVQIVRIDRDYVDARLKALSLDEDLSRFILYKVLATPRRASPRRLGEVFKCHFHCLC